MLKFFSGTTEVFGMRAIANEIVAARFPGVVAMKNDGYKKLVGYEDPRALAVSDDWLPITRMINYSNKPSLHKCDARCENAKGHNCECSCGGANHGKGSVSK